MIWLDVGYPFKSHKIPIPLNLTIICSPPMSTYWSKREQVEQFIRILDKLTTNYLGEKWSKLTLEKKDLESFSWARNLRSRNTRLNKTSKTPSIVVLLAKLNLISQLFFLIRKLIHLAVWLLKFNTPPLVKILYIINPH